MTSSAPLESKLVTLKTVLKGVKSGLKGLPPVQSAIDGLELCLAHIQIREKTRHEYEEIVSDLTRLASLLQAHAVEEHPWSLPYSIDNAASAIEEQTNFIRVRQDRPQNNELATVQDDAEVVMRCYRRVGALFQQLQADISLGVWDVSKEQQMASIRSVRCSIKVRMYRPQDTRLKDLCPAYDAYHDAALPTSATTRTGCTKDTRVDLLNTIQRWTRQEGASKIFWLNGMAGTGKTTIAYTLCEMLQKAKQLGASFFCSRNSPDCRDVNRMVPTIAYQLGRYSNPYRKALYNALRNDPDAAKRKIDKQFETLISKPLAEMGSAMPVDVVVVIDALDEFADVDGAQGVLNMLLGRADSLPIKFFVSSRPEPAIFERMTNASGTMRSILWLHDIEKSLVQADIHVYLTEALSSVHATPVEIRQLAESSGSLFIFAATAVRYLALNRGLVDYKQRLQVVLKLRPSQGNNSYKLIDELYSTVLSNAFNPNMFEEEDIVPRQQVLWTVVCAREPLTMTGIAEVLDLLNVEAVQRAILPMQSVLHVSETTSVVSTLHTSFSDFLFSKDRAGPFYCDGVLHESRLAGCCFRLMNQSLQFNICDLESSYWFDRDILDLQDRVARKISSGLFYSCRYWGEHLTRTSLSTPLLSLLESFLQSQLLFWMEVLNLKRSIGHGGSMLSQVLGWLQAKGEFTELWDFTYDARNFLTIFAANPISQSTPHIYVSVLPFTSTQNHVRRVYLPRMQGLIQIEGAVMERRAKSALATWGVRGMVLGIAQSRDGKRIVSGSGSNKINIWDASSGTPNLRPLEGHSKAVWSVAFSPDDTRIASGSADCTICIWDGQGGGLLVKPLHRHTNHVNCVVFSPDGTCLASGSTDRTIRLWDAYTGAAIGDAYRGHEGGVLSVVFSPNGEHLTSGSGDRTIRIWNRWTGAVVRGPIKGHTGAVNSVAYSSNGLRLASGSADCTVAVWDMLNGTLLAGPFKGHTKAVSSVSFSPDDTRVVSGSYDRTIRVWEAEGGSLLAGPFKGHDDMINSVLFTTDGTRIISGSSDGTIRVWDARHRARAATRPSGRTGSIISVSMSPDGTRIASGSDDRTICVWETHSGALVSGPFKRHTEQVNSVAFSSDGARIVSGSDDHTLCTWDASTGALLVGPIWGHPDTVNSVAFSPDGRRIASGSDHRTIRLLDSHTGKLVTKPLKGHTDGVSSIVFSPDGARIVSGSWDSTVRMWDASDGTALWVSRAHAGWVRCVAFSSDSARVVSGSNDRTIIVLDARDGAVLYGPFTGHTFSVASVAFSPDGTLIVSGSVDRTVRVWDVESGTMVAGPLNGHANDVYSVIFSHDGTHIVSGSLDSTIRFWDIRTVTRFDAASFDDLSINRDGWLTNSDSQLLLWVPSDLRHLFKAPSLSSFLVIGDNYTIRGDHSMLMLGERWSRCFNVS